jgi:O-antigen ligase
VNVLSRAARLAASAALLWFVLIALTASEVPILARGVALVVFGTTLWRPPVGLVAIAALVPAAALLAPAPPRGAELFAWAFLAAWLLRLWRPLAEAGVPRTIALPAVLYAASAVVSWIALNVRGAAGVPALALPVFLVNAIPRHYLVFSVPHAETWTMLPLVTGVALFIAAVALARADRALARRVASATVASAAVLAAATLAEVARQWAANDYGTWFLARYLSGERFSVHLGDVNAAGSQYVLAASVAAAFALFETSAQWRSAAALGVMAPAFWLTGSRTAMMGALAAALTIAFTANASRVRVSRRYVVAGALVLALVAVAGTIIAARGSEERGSAGRAMRLRSQFSETSARMFASAPLDGVGVGRYFERSPEFMPAELRALYGAENAHNYFAQQFAELGVIGGSLFIWVLAAGLAAGWRRLRAAGRDPVFIGLFAGAAGYLVTCITGHPFLVAEVALPFWIVFGVLASGDGTRAALPRIGRFVTAAAALLLLASVGRAALAFAGAPAPPPERGFEREDVAADGTRFRWMSPHVITYTSGGSGFLRMMLRAPDRPLTRPMVVETAIGGRVVDRRELPSTHWEQVVIPVRDGALSGPFRRVDVRVTPPWMDKRRFAQRSAEVDVALTAMVGELQWESAGR